MRKPGIPCNMLSTLLMLEIRKSLAYDDAGLRKWRSRAGGGAGIIGGACLPLPGLQWASRGSQHSSSVGTRRLSVGV